MAPTSGLSEWEIQSQYDWRTESGQTLLQEVVGFRVPYEPADWQLENTARLLMGKDVLCVSATGKGKSALMYMYSMVHPNTMTVVILPTNALEADMVQNLLLATVHKLCRCFNNRILSALSR